MKIVWTLSANADRKKIREYIALDNPIAALTIDELISQKAKLLVEHPNTGRRGRIVGTRELVIHRHYVLVYDIKNESVRILRVLHAARQY
ncbi:type II toxin-antitoxin system RelE/ParE family toxin [Xenorhabdus griffiniae]|uniref:type II toxin-antitoxin system RelE/ParE family toxin n=1 Tax=Xenorhabdus griffiniae TaxID=351672 RepID=UPI0023595086|nr:type II toxin-antitoxin system RelE/ParE family toxin [Xenorhabdus griffiniae]MDC9604506.1 type II toxin-antitoxin system RelE/ParE family toxin [Xenorhabdus griffiniae]